MAITFTEVDRNQANFAVSSNGWQDYDIYTNHGIPKGAVAIIVISNLNANTYISCGVRTDGSSISRSVTSMNEAEGGGATHITMLVTVHADTGLIEVTTSDYKDTEFDIMGYWEGVTFTEEMNQVYLGETNDEWITTNITYGTANRVGHFAVSTRHASQATTAGVREVGSDLERTIEQHESEPNYHNQFFPDFVTMDSNTDIETYTSDYNNTYLFYLGCFDETMEFNELWSRKDFTAEDNHWESFDLTSEIGSDGDVVHMILMHNLREETFMMGARMNSTTGPWQFVTEHEAESNGYAGTGWAVKTESDGTIELFSDDATGDYYWLSGYFSEAGAAAGTQTFLIDTLLKSFGEDQITLDTILKTANLEKMSQLSALFIKRSRSAFMLDILLRQRDLKQLPFDTLLKGIDFEQKVEVTSVFEQESVLTYLMDALLRETKVKGVTLDTLLKEIQEKGLSLDTILTALNMSEDVLFDIILSEKKLKAFIFDALFNKVDIIKQYELDSVFSAAIVSETVTHLIDAVLKGLNQTRTYTVDSVYMSEQIRSHLVSALLQETKTHGISIDVLQAAQLVEYVLVDTLFKGLDVTQTYTIDALIVELAHYKKLAIDLNEEVNDQASLEEIITEFDLISPILNERLSLLTLEQEEEDIDMWKGKMQRRIYLVRLINHEHRHLGQMYWLLKRSTGWTDNEIYGVEN